jgi:hypothetical protein
MGDFIVHEGEDEDADPEAAAAARRARRRAARRPRGGSGLPGVGQEALRVAADIFGAGVDDLLEMIEERAQGAGAGRRSLTSEEEEEEAGRRGGDDDDEGGAARGGDDDDGLLLASDEEAARERQRRAAARQPALTPAERERRRRERLERRALEAGLDPSVVQQRHLTARDADIRLADAPERFRARDAVARLLDRVVWGPSETDQSRAYFLDLAARWVRDSLFGERAGAVAGGPPLAAAAAAEAHLALVSAATGDADAAGAALPALSPDAPAVGGGGASAGGALGARLVVEAGVLEVCGDAPPLAPATPGGGGEEGDAAAAAARLPGGAGVPDPNDPSKRLWRAGDLRGAQYDLDLSRNRGVLCSRPWAGAGSGAAAPASHDDDDAALRAWRRDPAVQAALLSSVRAALELFFVRRLEVPAAAMHHKDLLAPLLALREADAPDVSRGQGGAAGMRWPAGTVAPQGRRLRRWDALWAVFESGVRFAGLFERRALRSAFVEQQLERLLETGQQYGAAEVAWSALQADVDAALTAPRLDDVERKLRAMTAAAQGAGGAAAGLDAAVGALAIAGGDGASAAAHRRPQRADRLRSLRQVPGLASFAASWALPPNDLAANVRANERSVDPPDDPGQPPAQLAAALVADLTADPRPAGPLPPGAAAGYANSLRALQRQEEESGGAGLIDEEGDPNAPPKRALAARRVLADARDLLIDELAAEPAVRDHVRRAWAEACVLETDPTPQGARVLCGASADPTHRLARAKRLRGKRLDALQGSDLFLRVAAAERAGLVAVRFVFSERDRSGLVASLARLYCRGSGSAAAGGGWDGQERDDVLVLAAAEAAAGRGRDDDADEEHPASAAAADAADLADPSSRASALAASSSAWDALRRAVLRGLVARLLPELQAEARQRLEADARDAALATCADALWEAVRRPPLRVFEQIIDEDQDAEQGGEARAIAAPRVMAVTWGPGEPAGGGGGRPPADGAPPAEPTTLVALDEQGALVDVLQLGQLSGNVPRSRAPQGGGSDALEGLTRDSKKSRDAKRVLAALREHLPHALLVGAAGAPQAGQVRDDAKAIVNHFYQTDARAAKKLETGGIEVAWQDERLAALWATSRAAHAELPDHSVAARRAVALARLALDPLAVAAALLTGGAAGGGGGAGGGDANGGGAAAAGGSSSAQAGSSVPAAGNELLALPLHDLQDLLPREDLHLAAERVLVTAVSQVGADVNALAADGWRRPVLQFVPGLGPRKAAALVRALETAGGTVKSRLDLMQGGGGGGGGSDDEEDDEDEARERRRQRRREKRRQRRERRRQRRRDPDEMLGTDEDEEEEEESEDEESDEDDEDDGGKRRRGKKAALRLLGPVVFANAAASLRVRASGVLALANEEALKPVDDMRVAPSDELLLRRLALAAAEQSGEHYRQREQERRREAANRRGEAARRRAREHNRARERRLRELRRALEAAEDRERAASMAAEVADQQAKEARAKADEDKGEEGEGDKPPADEDAPPTAAALAADAERDAESARNDARDAKAAAERAAEALREAEAAEGAEQDEDAAAAEAEAAPPSAAEAAAEDFAAGERALQLVVPTDADSAQQKERKLDALRAVDVRELALRATRERALEEAERRRRATEGGGEEGDDGSDAKAAADAITELGPSSRLPAVLDLLDEMLAPYGELRAAAASTPGLTEEEVFFLLAGETPATLRPGRLAEARVVFVGQREARVALAPSGAEAYIPASCLPPGGALERGQTVTARVVYVGWDDQAAAALGGEVGEAWAAGLASASADGGAPRRRFLALLSARPEDVRDERRRWERAAVAALEPAHAVVSLDEEEQQQQDGGGAGGAGGGSGAAQRRRAAAAPLAAPTPAQQRVVLRRPIEHPAYRRLDMHGAVDWLLRHAHPGALLFRPVLRGSLDQQASHLYVSFLLHVRPEKLEEAAEGWPAAGPEQHEQQEAGGAAALASSLSSLIPAAECAELLRTGAVALCHVVLAEAPKPPRALQLSTPLAVPRAAVARGAGGAPSRLIPEKYEDLDEVAARYVQPVVDLAATVAAHRNFCPGAREAVSARLRRAGQEALAAGRQAQGMYRLGLRVDSREGGSTEPAGYILCAGSAPQRAGPGGPGGGAGGGGAPELLEPFLIVPGGFWFRRRLLPTIEEVVTAFKRDPLYSVTQQQQQPGQGQQMQMMGQGQQQQQQYGGGAARGGGYYGGSTAGPTPMHHAGGGAPLMTPAHWGAAGPAAAAAYGFAAGPTPVHPGYGGGGMPPHMGGGQGGGMGPQRPMMGGGMAAAMTPAHAYGMPAAAGGPPPPPQQGYYGAPPPQQQQQPPYPPPQQQGGYQYGR